MVEEELGDERQTEQRRVTERMRAAEAFIAGVLAEGKAGKGDGTSAAGIRMIVYDWHDMHKHRAKVVNLDR
jgi:hypothetical protein